MNPIESRTTPPKPPAGKSEEQYLVGAKRNRDGTLDTSKAMVWHGVGEQVKEITAKSEEEKKRQRAKALEIPDSVEAGTSHKVWYDLRNALFVQKELTAQATAEKKTPDARQTATIKRLELEKSILDSSLLVNTEMEKVAADAERRGEKLTKEAIRERINTRSAAASVDGVQEHFIDRFQALQEKGEQTARHEGHEYPLQELIQAASDLQNRLSAEARHWVAKPEKEARGQ